jgi:hypothetical protein
MPASSEILNQLATISNAGIPVAVFWHVVFGFVIAALLLGWRPPQRTAAIGLALPLLSVSLFAWRFSNPFNGTIFLVFALLLAVLGLRLPGRKVRPGAGWSLIAGSLLIAFGWVYPHFLVTSTWTKYFYAAPTGLVPCSTLSLVIGFALLANGFGSLAWSTALAVIGIFYSLFGALRLQVRLDFILLAGALLLLLQTPAVRPRSRAERS